MTSPAPLPLGVAATLACLLEATAAKPGNVHRGADFDDLTYVDLVASAAVIGPEIEAARSRSVGETVLAAVEATRRAVATNSNLGTLLLLAPLARAASRGKITDELGGVLAELGPADARDVYAAIAAARPGGLGEVAEADVAGPAPVDLRAAMQLAAQRDLVARQYTNDFQDVLARVVPWLDEESRRAPLGAAIVATHLRLMAAEPDSLIARKCGPAVARQAADRAAAALAARGAGEEPFSAAVADLDFWLRSDGHRRNPGTTADLVAAGLFVALREGVLPPPYDFYNPAQRQQATPPGDDGGGSR